MSCFLSVSYPIVGLSMFYSEYSFGIVPSGCAIVSLKLGTQVTWLLRAVTSLIVHFFLLWPYIYPLIKHSLRISLNGCKLRPVIVRSSICSVVSGISDTIFYGICAMNVINNGVTIGIATQVNLMINLSMIIYVFPKWKLLLFAFCSQRGKTETPTFNNAHRKDISKKDEEML